MIKLWKKANILVKVCFVIVVIILFIAAFAQCITVYDPVKTDLMNKYQRPIFMGGSWDHILGTDELGRDVLTRVFYGTQVSIGMAIFGMILGGSIGTIIGLTTGYFGGAWDRLVQMLISFQQAVPFTLIVLIGTVIFGRNLLTLMIFIGIARWETYAKMIRGQVLSVRKKQYIEAAKCYNASGIRILFRYVFPSIRTSLMVLLTLNFPAVLLIESSLSFIGIGVQPPTATLGQIVGTGQNYLTIAPWVSLAPAFVIVLVAYCIQHIGEYLREHFDVRLLDE